MFDATLIDVASKLVAGCREGKEAEGLNTLYAEDAVSVEAMQMPGTDSRVADGLEAIRAKHAWWNSAMEVHASKVLGPFLHGDDKFAVIFEVQATQRENGNQFQMREIGVYTLKDGKIAREEFFFSP